MSGPNVRIARKEMALSPDGGTGRDCGSQKGVPVGEGRPCGKFRLFEPLEHTKGRHAMPRR
jgi:hypothetical protein